MVKKRRNKIVSLVLCVAFIFGTIVTTNLSHAVEETDLISQASVSYKNYDNVKAYREPEIIAPEAPKGMVFAGWYQKGNDNTYTALSVNRANNVPSAYAKFVDADVFDAKFQLTENTMNISSRTDIRIITTVDTMNYSSVGFNITFNGTTLLCDSQQVYAEIATFVNEEKTPIQPTVFSEASSYFVTHSIKNVTNDAFSKEWIVVPTWTTIDGTVVEATGDAIKKFYVNQHAEVYPYDLEVGVTFEDERDLYYVGEDNYGSTIYHTTKVSREVYDGSTRLAIEPVNFTGSEAYPHLHLNLGKTYPAGSVITFWFRYHNSLNNSSMVVTGCKDGKAVIDGVQISNAWVEHAFTYTGDKIKTITLLKDCDTIDIRLTMQQGTVAYYDDFKIVVPTN